MCEYWPDDDDLAGYDPDSGTTAAERREEILRLWAALQGLQSDLHYWDLCRMHGANSPEVLQYLLRCEEECRQAARAVARATAARKTRAVPRASEKVQKK